MAPWQVRVARGNLQGWDEAGLGVAILEVASTDASLKGHGLKPALLAWSVWFGLSPTAGNKLV
jgi:hypothetical protein